MYPEIHVLNHVIPTYSVTALLGVAAVLVYFYRHKWDPEVNFEALTIWGLIGTLAGAKLLYLLLCLPEFIRELPYLFQETSAFLHKYVYNGLVFYGGLYGCILAVILFCRVTHTPTEVLGPAVPAFPLFHAFGRLGCFCMGCCYGVPWEHGIVFSRSSIAPNDIPLVPVQLIEAIAEFVFFLLLVRKRDRFSKALGEYMILYGVTRFILEFFRGDTFRGFIGPFSLSQWISVLTWILGAYLCLRKTKEKASIE